MRGEGGGGGGWGVPPFPRSRASYFATPLPSESLERANLPRPTDTVQSNKHT